MDINEQLNNDKDKTIIKEFHELYNKLMSEVEIKNLPAPLQLRIVNETQKILVANKMLMKFIDDMNSTMKIAIVYDAVSKAQDK